MLIVESFSVCNIAYSLFHGTEWTILCWCAVKQLLTHSLFHLLVQKCKTIQERLRIHNRLIHLRLVRCRTCKTRISPCNQPSFYSVFLYRIFELNRLIVKHWSQSKSCCTLSLVITGTGDHLYVGKLLWWRFWPRLDLCEKTWATLARRPWTDPVSCCSDCSSLSKGFGASVSLRTMHTSSTESVKASPSVVLQKSTGGSVGEAVPLHSLDQLFGTNYLSQKSITLHWHFQPWSKNFPVCSLLTDY